MWPWGRALGLSPVVTTNLILDSQTEMATVTLAVLTAVLTDTDIHVRQTVRIMYPFHR